MLLLQYYTYASSGKSNYQLKIVTNTRISLRDMMHYYEKTNTLWKISQLTKLYISDIGCL